MNTDSSENVVVFEVLIGRRLQKLLGEGSTTAVDCIRRVWDELTSAFGLRPEGVRRVYSQWEPTPEDRAFIAAEFPPSVKVTYSFRRPPVHDWGQATPEFVRVVEEFERQRFSRGVERVRQRGKSRRPWWQYWD
jgi:hypothetical protein